MAPPVAAIVGLAGSAVSAFGQIQAGNAARADAEFRAQQADINAKQELASSQREAAEKRREARLLQSRQMATAAASGAGVTNPSIIGILEDTAARGDLNSRNTVYGGAERGRGFRNQAAGFRASGRAAQRGGLFSAAGTLFSGFGRAARTYEGAYSRYG